MGRRYTSQTTVDGTVTTTTEAVAATVVVPSVPRANVRVQIKGWAQITTGGSTTALTIRVRRGSTITDTLIGEANAEQVKAAAGSTEELSIMLEDTPGEVANQSYVVTLQQTGAAANGSILQAFIQADVDF